MKKQFLSLEALATTFGLPREYLRNLAKQGQIPYLNVNGRLRFSESEVRAALKDISKKGADYD